MKGWCWIGKEVLGKWRLNSWKTRRCWRESPICAVSVERASSSRIVSAHLFIFVAENVSAWLTLLFFFFFFRTILYFTRDDFPAQLRSNHPSRSNCDLLSTPSNTAHSTLTRHSIQQQGCPIHTQHQLRRATPLVCLLVIVTSALRTFPTPRRKK